MLARSRRPFDAVPRRLVAAIATALARWSWLPVHQFAEPLNAGSNVGLGGTDRDIERDRDLLIAHVLVEPKHHRGPLAIREPFEILEHRRPLHRLLVRV